MELDDFKKIWQEEKKELENRIYLNEKFINDMSLDKSISTFDRLVNLAIIGRNLALVYMLISFVLAFMFFENIVYSIFLIIGGIAMLFSFVQHLSIKKPDFSKMNTIKLQKSICRFRIHMSKHERYDKSIVALWFITLIPVISDNLFKYRLSSVQLVFILLWVLFVILVTTAFSKNVYKKWLDQLQKAEEQLQKVIEFEST